MKSCIRRFIVTAVALLLSGAATVNAFELLDGRYEATTDISGWYVQAHTHICNCGLHR